MSDNAPLKRCTKCGNEYPATTEYFHARKDRPCGLTASCKFCRLAAVQTWNKENHERHVANAVKWNNEHPERVKDTNKRYFKKNQSKITARQKKWYNENKDIINEKVKKKRRANPEKHRESNKRQYQKNPQKALIRAHKRHARLRALPATFTEQDWIRALEYFNNVCAYCGNPPSESDHHQTLHKEHHIPLNRGGGFTPDNIVPACQMCNYSKHDKEPEQWLIDNFGKEKARIISEKIRAYFASL